MRNVPLFCALLGTAAALLSCEKPACEETISGVVLGGTCVDGAVIEMDAPYAIGRPVHLRRSATDSIVGRNAIATGTELGPDFLPGQRIHFRILPAKTRPVRMCPTIPPLNVPHYDLTNVSTLACEIE